eukprot:1376306-Pyramimonas_sp.AAC.1
MELVGIPHKLLMDLTGRGPLCRPRKLGRTADHVARGGSANTPIACPTWMRSTNKGIECDSNVHSWTSSLATGKLSMTRGAPAADTKLSK